jgi:O-antigen/teichoic acid export membrane protein
VLPARAIALARSNMPAIWLLGATTIANVLAYGYQVVMARLLRPEDYAILTAFFAMLILEQLGGQVVQSATAKLAAQYKAHGDDAALHVFVRRWLRRILIGAGIPAALAIAAAFFISIPPLSSFAVALLGATLFLAILLTFTLGLLQGLARFGWFGSVYIAMALVRLVAGVGLVLFLSRPGGPGDPVNGAFLGAAAALAVGALGTLIPLRPLLRAARGATHEHDLGSAETRFFFLAAVIFMGYAALTFIDGLLAPWKIPSQAGDYAAAVTMGKIVLFAPIAVGFLLLERTSRTHALGGDPDRYLFASLGFVLVTSGAVALAYLVAPVFFTDLIVGEQYEGAAPLIRLYGLAALSNALLSLWIAYFVGRGSMLIGTVIALAVAVELALLLTVASDAASMVTIVLYVAVATQVGAVALYTLGRLRSPARVYDRPAR